MDFQKSPQITNCMKICPVGAELCHADGRWTDMTKLIVAFCSFSIVPKHGPCIQLYINPHHLLHFRQSWISSLQPLLWIQTLCLFTDFYNSKQNSSQYCHHFPSLMPGHVLPMWLRTMQIWRNLHCQFQVTISWYRFPVMCAVVPSCVTSSAT